MTTRSRLSRVLLWTIALLLLSWGYLVTAILVQTAATPLYGVPIW